MGRPCPSSCAAAPARLCPGGGLLRGWGHFLLVGDMLRVGGRDCCPRRRRMPPPGKARTWPRGMSPAGDIAPVRGHFLPVGDMLRVGGRDCGPRRRRMPPPGAVCAWPRGMSPVGSDGGAAGGSLHLLPGVLRSIRPSPHGRLQENHPRRSAMAQAVPDATEPGLQVVSTGLTSP